MPKTPSEELFELVKSLRKSEKAHFKMLTSAFRSGQQNELYIKLFKIIDEQKVYDEQKILEKLKMSKLRLRDLKNYLHSRILFSLEVYYSNKSLRSEVVSLLEQARILMIKSLFGQARKRALKALQISRKSSMLHYSLEALELYLFTFWRPVEKTEMEKIYKNVFREIRETVGQLNEYYDIKLLHAEMYLLGIQTGGNMGDVPEELLKKKISGYPWLVNNEKASSIRSQIVLLRQRYIYQRFLNNPEFLKYLNASDELFRKNTLLKKVYYRDYLTHLYNFISINISALSLKELDTFITEVEKLRTEMHESEFGNTSQSFYITKMRWYISNNKYKECLQYFKNTPLLSKNLSTSELDERLTIKSLLIEASLLGKEYKTALNWINSLLNEGYKTTRTDLFCHGRILLLCLHFSIENYDFLPNLTLQAKRFYKKYTAQNKAFDCLLDFFQKKEAAFYFANDRKKVLLELQQNLSELIKDPKLKIVLSDSFDYLKWLKTQLS